MSDRWMDWYLSLTPRQKAARWWAIHWPPLLALAVLLTAMWLTGLVLS